MKAIDWLFTFGTLSAGILIGRQMGPDTQPITHPTIEVAQPKLTREDVIHLIAANGSPEGLDLSDYDLSGVNLRNLDLTGVIFSTYLFGNRLSQTAFLRNTNFTDCNLTRVNLAFTDLQGASFWQASLYEACMMGIQAQDAGFSQADMRRVTLFGARLDGATFWRTKLVGANLNAARIADAHITEIDLGVKLLQEDEAAYNEYFDRWYMQNLPGRHRTRHLAARHQQAAEIYMNLKNAYLIHGRYREASWAYLRERRMRRTTMSLRQVKKYHSDETLIENPGLLRWRWGWFHLKYLWLWLFDWLADVTSGYGEKPLRSLSLALLVIIIFPILYWWSGQLVTVDGTPLHWLDYVIFSMGAFTTMSFARLATTGGLAETIASIQAMLGISILALLMFTLGNRISRS